jgi:GNAT superfamily N-acetyltransferase
VIREATLEDIPALLALGQRMASESPRFSKLAFSDEKLTATLTDVIRSPRGFLWVAEEEAELLGVMVAIVHPHWFSDDLIASDLALFVYQHARGGMAAARLVKQYKAWARESGAVLVQAGVSTGLGTETTAGLYERMGFERCGVILDLEA